MQERAQVRFESPDPPRPPDPDPLDGKKTGQPASFVPAGDEPSFSDPTSAGEAVNPIVVSYVTSWSVYARGFRMTDVPAHKITHLIYAFAQIGSEGTVELFDPNADIVKVYGPEPEGLSFHGNFAQLQKLKNDNPHLKTLISIGGWTRSAAFSDLAANPEKRMTFAHSVLSFLRTYGFDGVDIDWEYPVEGGAAANPRSPDDGWNFVLLLEDIRRVLSESGSETPYLLTAALSPNPKHLAHVDLPSVARTVDFVNLMAYNYAGSAAKAARHQAPLYNVGGMSVAESVIYAIRAGIVPGKLVLGIPAFGRGLYIEPKMEAEPAVIVGKAGVPGSPPRGTWNGESFDFAHIQRGIDDRRPPLASGRVWDPDGAAAFIYHADSGLFISYDDDRSVREKAEMVQTLGLAGVMFWEASADPDGILISAARDILFPEAKEDRVLSKIENDYRLATAFLRSIFTGISRIFSIENFATMHAIP